MKIRTYAMFAVGTEECVLLTFEVREPLVRGAGKKKNSTKELLSTLSSAPVRSWDPALKKQVELDTGSLT